MTLVKSNRNFPAFGTLFSDFFGENNFFENEWLNQKTAAVNVKETENNFEIEVAAPGLSKEDFEVSLDNGRLNISAQKEESNEDSNDSYTRKEFSYSSFKRSFSLPENIKQEDVKAKYEDGVLRLTLNKKEPTKALPKKTVEIG